MSKRLGLRAGEKVAWSVLSIQTLVCRPKQRRLTSILGLINQPGRGGESIGEMRTPDYGQLIPVARASHLPRHIRQRQFQRQVSD